MTILIAFRVDAMLLIGLSPFLSSQQAFTVKLLRDRVKS